MGGRISLMLIDQSRLFREGIKRIFAGSDFEVGIEAADIGEALSALDGTSPVDLVLTEFSEDEIPFAEQISALRKMRGNIRIVVLTSGMDGTRLTTALEAGADGYLLKDMSADALLQSLHLVLLGEKVFPTDLARCLINGIFHAPVTSVTPRGAPQGRTLSDREVQILNCLLGGYSNKMIANRLQISEGTVKVHLKGILKKINVQNRTQAAIWALNNGVTSGISDGRHHFDFKYPARQQQQSAGGRAIR